MTPPNRTPPKQVENNLPKKKAESIPYDYQKQFEFFEKM